jgi:hypothetical protein
MKIRVFLWIFLLSIAAGAVCTAQSSTDMLILQEDIVVEPGNAPGTTEAQAQAAGTNLFAAEGVTLYIRKKAAVQSVMLVETTKDPAGKEDNYAYRALEFNTINGTELRYLDGKLLESKFGKFSLISSTVVNHPMLGECFKIYIPPVVEYGYPWTRHGTVSIAKGMFINIRTFSKKYGDYTGDFADNPFMFDFAEYKKPESKSAEGRKPVELTLTDDYNPTAATTFNEIAEKGKGLLRFSKGPKTLPDDIIDSLETINPRDKVDVVFAIDTTGSMKDDMETLRTVWVPELIEELQKFGDVRLGLLLYRDYGDSYNYKNLPVKYFSFTSDVAQFTKNLGTVKIKGKEGGDVPEAVYEALYASIEFYAWRTDAQKKIILIGDAEPHPTPRGTKKISQEQVVSLSQEKQITLDCIIVPDDKAKSRGR